MKSKFKNKRIGLLCLFLMALFWSCNSTKTNLGLASDYFPDIALLKNGIVNKYYIHTLETDAYNPSTIIEYREFILKTPTELSVNLYNAAFEKTRSTNYLIEEEQVRILAMEKIFRGETPPTAVLQSTYYHWAQKEATTETRTTFKNGGVRTILYHRELRGDTIIQSLPMKRVDRLQKTSYQIGGKAPIESEAQIEEYYAQSIGLFSFKSTHPGGTTTLELVEQIPINKFQQMANHGIKRVAYIDSTLVLDKGKSFRLCHEQDNIVDYYNGGLDRAGFIGGKRALWATINSKVDKSKLGKENGFLTFRFVVNCQGEIGWFVTEEADFNYQKKQFAEETVQHLYEIVSQLDQWNPCVVRGENRDAYTYLTFKIDRGDIIELLP